MQLVAYGAQDIYLTGNPQITFFKVVYRRHTNFSMEAIEQTFNGNPGFGKKVSCTISRNGDLIHRVYLQTTLPEVDLSSSEYINAGVVSKSSITSQPDLKEFNWVNWVGHQLIKNVEVEIGGQRIDKHYGEWLHLWNELTQSPGLQAGYARMVGNVHKLVTPNTNTGARFEKTTLYIPLQFWFCRNPGLALPLIALQYHEVKINVEFNDLDACASGSKTADGQRNPKLDSTDTSADNITFKNGDLSLEDTALWVDYIYLDTDERRRFAQVSHEYLIEQLQFTGEESISTVSNKVKLNFNHPIKEIVWVVQSQKNVGYKQFTNYSDFPDNSFLTGTTMDPLGLGLTGPLDLGLGNFNQGQHSDHLTQNVNAQAAILQGANAQLAHAEFDVGVNPIVTAKLQLNGHDRFQERRGDYFNYVQPYQHHTNTPALGINVYSFGLKPEEHQPSGTCNFSRIDNATLQMTVTPTTVHGTTAKVRVYATNYNVLRIMSGMGGLAYSN